METARHIAERLGLRYSAVLATLTLFEDGASVPFIARYRKERTGALDEMQIRSVAEQRDRLAALQKRRDTILRAIAGSPELTDALRRQIASCQTKVELEELYAPLKKKRKTKAAEARERGLGPLAERILQQPRSCQVAREANAYLGPQVRTVEEALSGAKELIVEHVATSGPSRADLRHIVERHGVLECRAVKTKTKERTKFEDYYEYDTPIARIPSHRYLAVCRGEQEGILRVRVRVDDEVQIAKLLRRFGHDRRSPCACHLEEAVEQAYRKRLLPAAQRFVRSQAHQRAETDAIDVFADNLRNLLLSSPFGGRPVVAVDPGIRTGCKLVALDSVGNYIASTTIFPSRQQTQARDELIAFLKRHPHEAIAVGNGTFGREALKFIRARLEELGSSTPALLVSESGASVYSASDIAREEFPSLDITLRGAISIGRRLQDPLAELVKIDPKAIGVGQYQHDVDPARIATKLSEVVESCVHAVGVDLNTASIPLLGHVSGIGRALAKQIVTYRERSGGFQSRAELRKVKGLGERAFEQCAGFLRVRGKNPLDASAVHPERYGLVKRIASDMQVSLNQLLEQPWRLNEISFENYFEEDVGSHTMRDIVDELHKPGRDPRATFEVPEFLTGVDSIEDLREGMELEGVVTNVTDFGAFVDVGVHQDGLVHISQISDGYVRDVRSLVRTGEQIRVRVLSVDLERKRISLSRRGLIPARVSQTQGRAGQ